MSNGRYVWFDLLTTDPAGAKAFYNTVLGLGTSQWEGGDGSYAMWMAGDKAMGGVMELPAEARAMGAPTHWFGHITCADADAAVAAATARGATVLMPLHDMPGVGRMATLRDPWGGVFSAFTPGGEMNGSAGEVSPGEVAWVELIAADSAAAVAFYSDIFGWEDGGSMDMGPQGVYRMYKVPGDANAMGGAMDLPPGMPSGAWMFYFQVDNVADAIARATAAGGQCLFGPQQIPGGNLIAQLMDPQGGAFAIHGPPA